MITAKQLQARRKKQEREEKQLEEKMQTQKEKERKESDKANLKMADEIMEELCGVLEKANALKHNKLVLDGNNRCTSHGQECYPSSKEHSLFRYLFTLKESYKPAEKLAKNLRNLEFNVRFNSIKTERCDYESGIGTGEYYYINQMIIEW